MFKVTLSTHIVAHTSRREMAEKLASQVQASAVWVDDGSLGEWKNHLRAWKAALASGCTHAVILQDDALPIDNFVSIATQCAEIRPDDLISFYVGTKRPRHDEVKRAVAAADASSASWLTANTLMWGVGVMLPVSRITEMLEVCAKSRLPYDQRIGYWAEKTDKTVYYTWPSLVDHADEPSVQWKGQQGARVAHKVGPPVWNETTVHIEKVTQEMLASVKDFIK